MKGRISLSLSLSRVLEEDSVYLFSVIRAQFNDRRFLLSLSAGYVTRIDRKSERVCGLPRASLSPRVCQIRDPEPSKPRQPRKELFLSIRAYATSPNPWQGVLLLRDDDDSARFGGNFGRRWKKRGTQVLRDARKARAVPSWRTGETGRGERHGGTEGGPQDQVRGKGSPSRVPYIYNRGAFRVK